MMPRSTTSAPMASSMCMQCLKRSLIAIERLPPKHRSFSTTTSTKAQVVKKKGVVASPTRGGSRLRLTQNKRVANTRPPAEGERRAIRSKVILSNTNALEVAGLSDLRPGNATADAVQKAQGRVMGLQNDTVDALRALGAFKPTQGWSLFRRPATLIRKETVDLARDLDWVANAPGEGRAMRTVLFGERGSGKSVLQLQAMAMAHLKGWVVVHIPEAKELTNAHTSYEPIETPNGIVYAQPHITAKLLENMAKANPAILAKLQVKKQHNLPVPIPAKTSLARLAEIGARDVDIAWPIWQALWTELLTPDSGTPPVLFTLDAFDHVMRLSAYLNPESEPIHAHELTLVKHFVDLLSGKTQFPNGGMVLAATSQSNRAAAHTLDHTLTRKDAIQSDMQPPAWDPYVAHDKWVQDAMENVGVKKLTGLSKEEARGVIEYYARSGMLRSAVTEGLVNETWTLAGGGIIGQVESCAVRARF